AGGDDGGAGRDRRRAPGDVEAVGADVQGHQPVDAGYVDEAAGHRRAAVPALADLGRELLAALVAEVGGIEEEADALLADGEDPPGGEQDRAGRPEVDVVAVEGLPVGGREVVDGVEGGVEVHDGVAVVEARVRLAVAGGDPEVAAGIDGRPPRRPDARLPAGGHDPGREVAGAVGGRGDHRTLVGPAVAVQAAEGDVDAPAGDRGRPPLLLDLRGEAGRVDRPLPADGAAGQVESEQLVVGSVGQEGDDVDGAGARVDHRGAGDAGRVDVPAGQRLPRHGRSEVLLPHHGAGPPVEGVDGVGLGHHDDAVAGDERLGVDLAV